MKKCEFSKEEFYSISENKKIKLLCNLNEKGKLNIKYNGKIENTLDDIRNDLDIERGSFLKKTLEEFLNLRDNNEKELDNKKEEKKDEDKIGKEEKENKEEKKIKEKEQEKNKDDNNEEKRNIIIQKLGLIKLILENYDPIKKYIDLKKFINDINEKIKDIKFHKKFS